MATASTSTAVKATMAMAMASTSTMATATTASTTAAMASATSAMAETAGPTSSASTASARPGYGRRVHWRPRHRLRSTGPSATAESYGKFHDGYGGYLGICYGIDIGYGTFGSIGYSDINCDGAIGIGYGSNIGYGSYSALKLAEPKLLALARSEQGDVCVVYGSASLDVSATPASTLTSAS